MCTCINILLTSRMVDINVVAFESTRHLKRSVPRQEPHRLHRAPFITPPAGEWKGFDVKCCLNALVNGKSVFFPQYLWEQNASVECKGCLVVGIAMFTEGNTGFWNGQKLHWREGLDISQLFYPIILRFSLFPLTFASFQVKGDSKQPDLALGLWICCSREYFKRPGTPRCEGREVSP